MKRKAHTNPLDLTELKRLYCDEGLTIRAIAAKYDVTFQGVHDRLVRAGVKMRPRVKPFRPVKKRLLVDLYVDENLSIQKVAERLGIPVTTVVRSMDYWGMARRRPGNYKRESPLASLKIGDHLEFPRPERRWFHSNFYDRAKNAGIRVSIRTVDDQTVQILRVA